MEKLRTYFPQTEQLKKQKNKFIGEPTQVGPFDMPSLLKHCWKKNYFYLLH